LDDYIDGTSGRGRDIDETSATPKPMLGAGSIMFDDEPLTKSLKGATFVRCQNLFTAKQIQG
jgi:hypothetical protein